MPDYTKIYQTVVAGRVREDELSWFGLNKIATLSGVAQIKSRGGKKLPKFEKDYMNDTGMGKPVSERDPAYLLYHDSSYNK